MFISKENIVNAMSEAGIEKADTVLVHSNIAVIGTIADYSKEKLLNVYYSAFEDILGEHGTLCVPAFFYEYGRFHTPYDIKHSPVSKPLGVFSQYIALHENAVRSRNPLAAISALGKKAEHICGGENFFSYGADSPWERLYNMNAKMLFMGIDCRAMTFIHFIEYRVGVPHMYNKIYNIPVFKDGEKIADSITAYVRYLKYGIMTDYSGWTQELRDAGLIREASCGNGKFYVLEMQPVFDFYTNKLFKNPYHFLKQPPEFIPGEIPNDSPTGPASQGTR